jgi:PHD/YefM family antitoxin component YafN of YafNO toxin-antitoxin module
MPEIRGSTDLIENFQEIVDFCEENREPVFITENGRGKLAVMSMGTYKETVGRIELYNAIEAGLAQIKNGETIPEDEMFKHLNSLIGK